MGRGNYRRILTIFMIFCQMTNTTVQRKCGNVVQRKVEREELHRLTPAEGWKMESGRQTATNRERTNREQEPFFKWSI
jgi:hypothetical protein